MKIAIAGLGSLGKRWAEVLSRVATAEFAAFIDPLLGRPETFPWLAEYPSVPKVRRIEGLGGVEVDAVLVTAFSPAHADAVRDALKSRLHVLVEKPFTTTIPEAKELVALADQEKLTLMVSQNYRFFPGPQTLRKIVRSGELGAVKAVVGQFWCDWPGKPYQHEMLHPMGLEMAVHHFDLVRAIFDANPLSGWVQEWNPKRSPYRTGGALEAHFTMANAHAQFPFLYSGSLVTQGTMTPWGGLWRFEFDRGTIIANVVDGTYGLFRANGNQYHLISAFADESMAFDKSFNHFHESVMSHESPWSSGADNLNTLSMVLDFIVSKPETTDAEDRSARE
ncbi:MAG TPA: Gfo/Idh/MocA family oxidoreductase [Chthoniobacterales bacterium]|nr:Gfo/Idh/MocA family oxidoreductase [Chthoniobacterales bacterium]